MANNFTKEELTAAMGWIAEKYKDTLSDNAYVIILADKLKTRPSVIRDLLAEEYAEEE